MTLTRLAAICAALAALAAGGCTKHVPDEGPLTATSDKVTVSGEYRRAGIDNIERITIDGNKLVLHGASATQSVDLPRDADPEQKNRGWALVTEGEGDDTRTLTFTQETSLEDFTITVPAAQGQVAYGSLGGRDGSDVLLFAYGTTPKAYWGWATIRRRAASTH